MAQFTPQIDPAYRVEIAPEWGEQRWVQIPKEISRDPYLSTEAVGAVVRLVDNDSQFRFTRSFLETKLGWGEKKTTTVLGELKAAGYVETKRDRDEKGRMVGETVYVLYPTRRFQPDVSAGQTQKPSYRLSGSKQPKRNVSAGKDVSAGQTQNPPYRPAGDEQPKRNVSAGHIQRGGNRPAGDEQPKRNVSAGHIQRGGYEGQIEPKKLNLKNTHTPDASPPNVDVVDEGVCVPDGTKTHELVDAIVEGMYMSVRRLVIGGQRQLVVDAVTACLAAGHDEQTIVRQCDGATREGTTHPGSVASRRLWDLAQTPPSLMVPKQSGGPGGASEARPCPDCGLSMVGTVCAACVSEALAAGGVR
ncbi:hypothetical protein [Stackebrandtia soli]|uniref:hypothetical protein n=1 Tax=Stackebrandtia soli TaxID=1892856 RepID=UPI0039EAE27B